MVESKLIKNGYFLIAGVDEVGRGALAGPVVASAVLFDHEVLKRKKMLFADEIKDSKLLSAKQRENLFEKIVSLAMVAISEIPPAIIDRINIGKASLLAMKKAVLALPFLPEILLIDGVSSLDIDLPQIPIVDGDNSCFVIACASIVAKVFRDRVMSRYDEVFPQYGFSRNKGYGTSYHCQQIAKIGLSPIHRKSFAPCRALAC